MMRAKSAEHCSTLKVCFVSVSTVTAAVGSVSETLHVLSSLQSQSHSLKSVELTSQFQFLRADMTTCVIVSHTLSVSIF